MNLEKSGKGETELGESEYQYICRFLNDNSGISLGENKQYLVKSRLNSVLHKFDFNSFKELAHALEAKTLSANKLREAVIEAMTTNETSWFRDSNQFDVLKKLLFPELFAQKNATIKVWSAACSSGQEPYSISICFLETLQQTGKNRAIQIIGTDISETMLTEAKNAVYSEPALNRGLDANQRQRYFTHNYEGYKLMPEVSNQVRFQQFNLLKPFTALGHFDIIFCRNVLIYFSEHIKRDILLRLADSLESGGYLFMSNTESMPGDIPVFETIHDNQVTYYKKC